MLYTTKYAPKKLNEIIGNKDKIDQVKQWMLSWINNKKRKPLLIWGAPGVGKTSIAYALKNEFDADIIEMNASELRNKKRVQRVLGGSSLASTLFGNLRLVLIDDADILAGRKDSGGSNAITAFLKEAPCPIIVTATNIWDKKFGTIRNECEKIEMKRINKLSLRNLLKNIATKENLDLSDELVQKIADNSNGDVRAALNDLQSLIPSSRMHEEDIFRTIRNIFKASTYSDAKEAIKGDIDYELIKLWIDENIPNEYHDADDIAAAYDSLSMADIFDGRIRKTYWKLLKYSIDLSVAGVALAKKKSYNQFTKYNFPSYLRNMASTVSRRATLKSIGLKIGRKLHVNRKTAIEFLPFIKEAGKSHSEEIVNFYDFSSDELAFVLGTSVSRLKKK